MQSECRAGKEKRARRQTSCDLLFSTQRTAGKQPNRTSSGQAPLVALDDRRPAGLNTFQSLASRSGCRRTAARGGTTPVQSLADAESAEHAVEHVIGIDRAGNLTKLIEYQSQVRGNELFARTFCRRLLGLT